MSVDQLLAGGQLTCCSPLDSVPPLIIPSSALIPSLVSSTASGLIPTLHLPVAHADPSGASSPSKSPPLRYAARLPGAAAGLKALVLAPMSFEGLDRCRRRCGCGIWIKLEALADVPVSSEEFDPFGAPGDVLAVWVAAAEVLAGMSDRDDGTVMKPEEAVELLE